MGSHGAFVSPRVLTAGRLWDAGKDIATIDAAAALLDTPVLAAGPLSGPDGTAIECRDLRCLGALDEASMSIHFAAAAVFVSASRYEPFGLAVLEAAQAGCALVLSDIPTFREMWDSAAIFFRPGDPAALAAAVRDSLPACAQRGAVARQRASSFTAERMAAGTWRIHQALHTAPARTAA